MDTTPVVVAVNGSPHLGAGNTGMMLAKEAFTAHLTIADGACTYAEGPAERPGLVVRTPAGVWLAIARGELDGQTAFMRGQYTAEGDLTLLFKLKGLFG